MNFFSHILFFLPCTVISNFDYQKPVQTNQNTNSFLLFSWRSVDMRTKLNVHKTLMKCPWRHVKLFFIFSLCVFHRRELPLFWILWKINKPKQFCLFQKSKSFASFLHINSTFFKMGFISCKAEHSLQGMDWVTRKRRTKWLKHTRKLFRKNLQIKGIC